MENLETLKTVIKFVSSGGGDVLGGGISNATSFVSSGGGDVPGATAASTSSVVTGDFAFMLLAAIVLVCGACAIGAILFQRKKVSAGAHVGFVNQSLPNKLAIPMIAIVTCLFALSLTTVGLGNIKALAENKAALTGGEEIIATVDQQTGDTVFSETTITNTCEENAQKVSSFALNAIEGVDVSDVTWKITIGDIVVFNNKIGETSTFTVFEIAAKSSVTMKVEASGLTSEKAKSLINKEVATGITSYTEVLPVQYYAGVVQSPVEISGTVTDTGLEGATVTFTPESSKDAVTSTTTDVNGNYTLNVSVGTAGTITATKVSAGAEGDYGYSTDSFTVNPSVAEQTTICHIGKIKSLAVKVYQYDGTEERYDFYDRWWCPAFADSSIAQSDIKFYAADHSTLVDGTGTKIEGESTYMISDMYDKLSKSMVAQYYAICKAKNSSNVENVLHCYQVADKQWDDVFQEMSSETGYPKLGELKDTFSMDSVCDDITAKVIHFDGSSDAASWTTNVKESTASASCPTLNNIAYCNNSSSDGWYASYGGYDGGVLGYYSVCPWSAVASGSHSVFSWIVGGGLWFGINRDNYSGVVLSRIFMS